jgi:metallophosphoesterase superfamily enzyme
VQIRWTLVLGNHDIIHRRYYSSLGFSYSKELKLTENIELLHEAKEDTENFCTISGHLHPGVELRGKGRQKLVLPCFYFGDTSCILPAMGKFTGLARLQLKAESGDVFVTTEEEIFPFATER